MVLVALTNSITLPLAKLGKRITFFSMNSATIKVGMKVIHCDGDLTGIVLEHDDFDKDEYGFYGSCLLDCGEGLHAMTLIHKVTEA